MELLLKLYRGGYMSAEGVSESKMILEKGIVLPWCGEDEKKCKNIKKNGGLYTQCDVDVGDVENVEYCKACEKSISKNGGVCEYGNVSERLSCGIMEYVDRKGGKVKSYSEYMKKNKLERSDVEKYGQMCGVVIPACHFENDVSEKKKRDRPKSEQEMTALGSVDVEKKKRGRPKSEQEMTALGRVDVEKKKRGRPKKEKQVVANGAGEELIASLCLPTACLPTAELRCQDTSESSSEASKPSADMADDEEETIVIKFDILGVTYLKSQDNVLYDINTHDAVGVWNEEKSEIDELPDEEEEE